MLAYVERCQLLFTIQKARYNKLSARYNCCNYFFIILVITTVVFQQELPPLGAPARLGLQLVSNIWDIN